MNTVSVTHANTLKRLQSTSPVAFEEIRRNASTQFDPEIVAAFERSWSSRKGALQKPGDRRS
jgi:HD-GYP domain-containing protein (c-di-GMP phosphodiesterase class II)